MTETTSLIRAKDESLCVVQPEVNMDEIEEEEIVETTVKLTAEQVERLWEITERDPSISMVCQTVR